MKKIFFLLLFLPLSFMFSCTKDDDLAQVDLTLTLDNVTELNGNFYTISGNEISIEGVDVKSLNGKPATITNVIFYFEGRPIAVLPGYMATGEINTSGLKDGTYTLSLTGQVLEEGKTITDIAANYSLTIVSNEENIPEEAPEIGTYSVTYRIDAHK